MPRVFKPLRCLLPVNGKPCGRYLADVEADVPVTLRFTCPIKHRHDDKCNRIEFTQNAHGFITYQAITDESNKIYMDDGLRAAK